MSVHYLFGAEVNQIQATLFAASRQRQVVGGSRLLAEFSDMAGAKANQFNIVDVIVNKGGKFWLVFPSAADANQFGQFLADSYLLLLNGRMTIGSPQPYDATKSACSATERLCLQEDKPLCFNCAKHQIEDDLRQLKTQQAKAVASVHAPTTAFCQSSGFGLASRFEPLTKPDSKTDDDPQYMSAESYAMKEVGHVTKKGQEPVEAEEDKSFLDQFVPAGWQKRPWVYRPETVARYDSLRSNIAYLVADGNNMGKYFSYCQTKQELETLSKGMDAAVQRAISHPIKTLSERLGTTTQIPLLPLIAAGDDIFIMLPAPYSLDYARQFCLEFERALQNEAIIGTLQERAKGELNPPTMSAAVVICKASYPYNLAYQRGHDLLARTKQVVKTTGQEKGEWYSAVSFDVIVGSELVSSDQMSGEYRYHLTTYWAVDYGAATSPTLPTAAGDLQALLDQRLMFKRLPTKRRNEALQLFDADNLGSPEWNKQLKFLQQRIETTDSVQMRNLFDDALMKLGDSSADSSLNPAYWRFMERSGRSWWAQGLADLLEVWHYAQMLTKDLSEYEEERA